MIMLYLFIPVLTYLLPEYFLLGIICILVLILLRHLALYHTRLGSVTDSPGPHVQVMELRAWLLPVIDQSSAAVAWSLQLPREHSFVLFIYMYFLCCPYMYIFCIPAFAHQ